MSSPMFGKRIIRVLGALALAVASAGALTASCSTPHFGFDDAPPSSPTHCDNQVRDADETDLDCGGTCSPCALTRSCGGDLDCREGTCIEGTCQAAGCTDRVQNGSETDIDCGGGACKACPDGLACTADGDCQSGVCSGLGCAAPSCGDRHQNGAETDVDCGGPECSACVATQHCLTPSDCVGEACMNGTCALTCGAGFDNCDGDLGNACETNLRTDPAHCGSCTKECDLSNAQASCASGVCRVESCVAPFADCNGDPSDGCEVNTKTDVANCGACAAKPCPTLNGAAYCADSACGITCDASFADCDGEPGNGCEKDVSVDIKNCGGCGKLCTPSAGKTAWCRKGECGETTCAAGRGDCNGDPDDDAAHGGCETDFESDPLNCGACGTKCGISGGVAQCAAGQCTVKSCTTGLADCTGGYKDGCETNVTTDVANCGSCGKACLAPGGTPGCVMSACRINSCTGTNQDCNGQVADGCEVNTATNPTHCGACSGANTNCNTLFPNGSAHCAGSACTLDGCATDYLNCDTVASNGCEVNSKTDKNHCGSCSVTCGTANTTATACTGGSCTPTCAAGFKNCGTPQQGCNVQLGTTANCTTCGDACTGATPYCTASGCSGHLDIGVVGPGLAAQMGFSSMVPTLTKSHTLSNGAGNSRIVLVGVTATEPYLQTEQVKYNGAAMTLAVQAQSMESHSYAGIFYLLDSALPTAGGSYPVTVSFNTNAFDGSGAFNVIELKNVAQTNPLVTTAVSPLDTDCNVQADRSITLSFTQAGSFGYAVIGARSGTNPTPNPGVLVQTMSAVLTSPTPLVGVAGYAGPLNASTTLTWNIANCWNSAAVAIALKRLGT